MKIALFGGTFDPIHTGHLRAARAAVRSLGLDRVLFIPSGRPPHKNGADVTPFAHRFAMVALACRGERRFVPSLLEAPNGGDRPNYSIETVRAAKGSLRRGDQLYFLVGVDAFLDLPHWKDYQALLGETNFIVVSRPGFGLDRLLGVVPPAVLAPEAKAASRDGSALVRLRTTRIHVLRSIEVPAASHAIRRSLARGRGATGLVPPLVEEYILKEGLYRSGTSGRRP